MCISLRAIAKRVEGLEKILLKAEELFFVNGVKSTTMDDLARALGASKKTLYQFVENKDDLVFKVMDQHLALEIKAVNKITSHSSNAIEELLTIARHVTGHLKTFNPNILSDMQKYYPQAWGLFISYKNTFIYNTILENVQKGIAQGLYRDDLHPEIIAKIYGVKSEFMLDQNLFPFTSYTIVGVYNEYLKYHIRGIASAEGIKYLEQIKTI